MSEVRVEFGSGCGIWEELKLYISLSHLHLYVALLCCAFDHR